MTVQPLHQPALVSRPLERAGEADRYLVLDSEGVARWTMDPALATAFDSMREAARVAIHLPGALRAYGMPLRSVIAAHGLLN